MEKRSERSRERPAYRRPDTKLSEAEMWKAARVVVVPLWDCITFPELAPRKGGSVSTRSDTDSEQCDAERS
jgi:hypothetical protein